MNHREAAKLFVCAVALFGALAVLTPLARGQAHRVQLVADRSLSAYELEQRNTSAFARILGEFRAGAADMMFLKTQRYIHGGMAWDRPDVIVGGQHANLDEIQSLIPTRERDFRGILGEMERAVKPFMAEHEHAEMDELLPWFRLMTHMNPHFVRAYRSGGRALVDRGPESFEEGRRFLQEGLDKNQGHPEQYLLHLAMADVYVKVFTHAGEWEQLGIGREQALESALEHARLSAKLGTEQRPPRGEEGKKARDLVWTIEYEDELLSAVLLVAVLLERQQRADEALQWVDEWLVEMPGNRALERRRERLVRVISEP